MTTALRSSEPVRCSRLLEPRDHLALAVDDIDAAIASLQAEGVEIAVPPTDVPNDSGDRFAFIFDNERGLIELMQAAGPSE